MTAKTFYFCLIMSSDTTKGQMALLYVSLEQSNKNITLLFLNSILIRQVMIVRSQYKHLKILQRTMKLANHRRKEENNNLYTEITVQWQFIVNVSILHIVRNLMRFSSFVISTICQWLYLYLLEKQYSR